MLRYGYDRRFASGVIAASGTLAQIIPPSLVLIIMADQLGRSVGDMYAGAFIPGIALAGLYAAVTLVVTIRQADAGRPRCRWRRARCARPNGKSGITSVARVGRAVAAASRSPTRSVYLHETRARRDDRHRDLCRNRHRVLRCR